MSGPDRRDVAIEALLRSGTAAPPADEQACLDPETLAAWLDGGLPTAARDAAEAHVATCARCQVLVGAMARTEPVAVPAVKPQRHWFGWLAPLTAAAAALIMWVALPHETPAPAAEQLSTRVEPADLPTGQSAPTLPIQPAAPRQGPPASADNVQPQRRDERDRDAASLADRVTRENAARADAPAPKADTLAARPEERPAAPSATPLPPPAATPSPAATSARAAGGAQAQDSRALVREFIPEVAVTSADGAIRWSLTADAVSKSVNGRPRTWVLSGGGRYFTAASAPSADICWLVGRGGVVMRTVDGQTFAVIPFPDQADLTAVTALDANRATVTTAAGTTWTTVDAGENWRP